MSCYEVDHAHIDLILTVAAHHTPDTLRHLANYPAAYDERTTLDALGMVLHVANVESVNDQYPHGRRQGVKLYTFNAVYGDIPIVDALKAIDCLRYQSIDWRSWENSQASKVLDTIMKGLVTKLPGYEEARTWAFMDSERKCYRMGHRNTTKGSAV